jgi:glycosyltransferase involved in cell wall biosynthesis
VRLSGDGDQVSAEQPHKSIAGGVPRPNESLAVLFVTPEFVFDGRPVGGLGSYVERASAGLAAMGHRPIVLVASDRHRTTLRQGVRVIEVDIGSAPLPLGVRLLDGTRFGTAARLWNCSALLARRVESLWKETPIDVVHYASYRAVGLHRLASLPSLAGISSISHLWTEMTAERARRSMRWVNHLEALALRRMDKLIGPSAAINAVAERWLGRSVETVETPFVPFSGVERPETAMRLTEGRPYLLFFGAIGRVKGADRLAVVARMLLERDPDALFVMAGRPIPGEGQEILAQIAAALGDNAERFRNAGALDRADLNPLIAGARSVVLPSRVDNLPNACIEAMAAGRVVVATRGASFEQLVEDGVSGILANQDPRDLAEKCLVAWSLDTGAAAELADRARRRASELAPERVLPRLVRAYRETIEQFETRR